MNRVQVVYDLTLQMKDTLDQGFSSKDREAVIKEIEKFLEQRDALITALKKPFTEEEKQLGKKLVHPNEMIQQRMNEEFTLLKQEMKQVKKQKNSNKNYVNPYRNVAIMDGMYLDKKK